MKNIIYNRMQVIDDLQYYHIIKLNKSVLLL